MCGLIKAGVMAWGGAAVLFAVAAANAETPVRFRDSATGFAIRPEVIEARSLTGGGRQRWERAQLSDNGRAQLALGPGRQHLSVHANSYRSVAGEFEPGAAAYRLEFHLDPISPPAEIQPATLAAQHRPDSTWFVGYVADDETGRPLANARVRTEPSGAETETDLGGFFRIYVPLQTRAVAATNPARLTFSHPGYRTEERRYLELWSEGDWVYRVALERGAGVKVVDERETRRRSVYPVVAADDPVKSPGSGDAVSTAGNVTAQRDIDLLSIPPPIRIPTNVRVLRSDGLTIDYVSLQTYCQRSLPSEWIASWGSTGPGNSGTNSLLAGAVAVRTYAIGYVNNPANANYDICGTTSCQVYSPTASDGRTTAAVNFTANYVMRQPGATRIGFKLTEYSAENNQLGAACGDGYTAPTGGCLSDPVCTGETTFGHGRGMCQWGTARWASGRRMAGRVTSDATTNGYPLQNWVWICEHYYPNLELVQGTPLAMNDYVQVQGTASLTVRRCADGGITNGTGCPQITTKPSGATGLILGGPARITSDGVGYTWWLVQWFDSGPSIGWSPENWLERVAEPVTVPPVLAPIPNFTINEGTLLTFTNTAVASAEAEAVITDFEGFASGTSSGTVLFRAPIFSGSTSAFLDALPNLTSVTGTFPGGNSSSRVLRSNWSWNASANPWLRLTTSGTASLPNPVLDVTRKLKFDIYSDKALAVGLGVRETGNPAGTPIGSNGGTSPAIIEWVAVTNSISGQPQPNRQVAASNWTTLVFNLPAEPARNFSGGNGVLSTATGLGVLEHLAFVPAAGSGAYDVYLDDFIVSTPKILTYSLSNAPPGATINASTGGFTWTPAENQGAGVYTITVIVTDNNLPPLNDRKTFQVTVNEVNQPPALAAIPSRTGHAGALLIYTNSATDADVPANSLTYSLASGAPAGATVGTNSGVFNWPTSDAFANTSNHFTLLVTDNGLPPLTDSESFSVIVQPRPTVQAAGMQGTNFLVQWSAISGSRYRVQFKAAVEDQGWTDLVPDVTATGVTAAFTNALDSGHRFYRVLVLGP